MTDVVQEVPVTPAQEQMLQSLLNVPHRALGPLVDTLKRAMAEDPYTASRFCAWLLTNPEATTIDDHRQAAAIALLTSTYPNYREAGRVALLGNAVYKQTFPKKVAGLPPFQIFRVEAFLRGEFRILLGDLEVERVPAWDLRARYTPPGRPAQLEGETKSAWHRRIREVRRAYIERETPEERKARAQFQHLKGLALRFSKARAKNIGHWSFQAKTRTGQALPTEVTPDMFRVERVADFSRPTRLMKGVMRDYLKALEASPKWFDSVVTINRREMFEAYRANYVPRDARAQAIMMGAAPADSTAAMIRAISQEPDANRRAQMVMEANLPLTVASSFLPNGPASWIALIQVMTPDQAVAASGWVTNSGILEVAPVRAAFEAKVAQAKSASRILGRQSAKTTDAGVVSAQIQAAEKAVARKQKAISKRVALVVDQSGSMDATLRYAAEFAGFLSASLPANKLLVIAFNSAVRRIAPREHSLMGWRGAMSELKANGGTDIGNAIQWLHRNRTEFEPEEVVLLTDGGENGSSHAAQVFRQYFPNVPVTIFGMGAWEQQIVNGQQNERAWHPKFAETFRKQGLTDINVYLPNSATDYNLFDQAATVLGGASRFQAILDTPLPYRLTN